MNNKEIIDLWKKFYINHKKYILFLNTEKVETIEEKLFSKLNIFDNSIKANIGLGYKSFNELSIHWMAQNLVIFLNRHHQPEDLNILIAYDGTDELKRYYETFARVMAFYKFNIFLLNNNDPCNISQLAWISKQQIYALIIHFSSANEEFFNYKLQIFNNDMKLLSNEKLQFIFDKTNYELAFISVKQATNFKYLDNDMNNQYVNYIIEKSFDINAKKIDVSLINSSNCSTKILINIFQQFKFNFKVIKYFNKVNKNNDIAALDYKSEIKHFKKWNKMIKLPKSDVLYLPSTNGEQLNIAVPNLKQLWWLNFEQIAMLILDFYLSYTIKNENKQNYYVVTNHNMSTIIKRICAKYSISLYEDEFYLDNLGNYQDKKLLLYFDDENRFLLNESLNTISNIFQTAFVFTQICNYYKTQKKFIHNILNNIVKKYSQKVLYINKVKMEYNYLIKMINSIKKQKIIANKKVKDIFYYNSDIKEKKTKFFYANITLEENETIYFTYNKDTKISKIFINTQLDEKNHWIPKPNDNDILLAALLKLIK